MNAPVRTVTERLADFPGWERFDYHEAQAKWWQDPARFQIVPAGRRSGKSHIGRRKMVRAGLACKRPRGRFLFLAPTRPQAKDLHWDSIKDLLPPRILAASTVRETDLSIVLPTGVKFQVMGMEKPQRAEGTPVDGALLDECADLKAHVWPNHIRPALSTRGRPGFAIFIGVPEGRNHYYDLYVEARAGEPGWCAYHWKSADILDAAEIEAARRELDELTFRQEYEADFVLFQGRAYYGFMPDVHAIESFERDPKKPIHLCFDFNVEPGVAAVVQMQRYRGVNPNVPVDAEVPVVVGEVYIPRNSNTRIVCRRLIHDYKDHESDVLIEGDATGGNRGTAAVEGSDWDIVREELKPVFGERLKWRVPKSNPHERARVNAVNSRFLNADGAVRLLIDKRCKRVVRDFEGVQLVQGGSGEIDKHHHKEDGLTHLSDAIGYMVVRLWPTSSTGRIKVEQLL